MFEDTLNTQVFVVYLETRSAKGLQRVRAYGFLRGNASAFVLAANTTCCAPASRERDKRHHIIRIMEITKIGEKQTA